MLERKFGDEAAGSGEQDAGAGEANGFAIPEAEDAAGEVREIEDGIEAAGATIAWIGVAGSVKRGNAVANPVTVVGEFDGSHLRVYGDWATCDRVESVFADGLIENVREIEAADVAAAEPAKIADANAVGNGACAGILIDDVADRRGADEETVVIVVDAAVVFVPSSDELGGVARKEKVLEIDVADHHLLLAADETCLGRCWYFSRGN